MASKQKGRGRKPEGAQADSKAEEEGKQRGQEPEKNRVVVVKMEEPDVDAQHTKNEDRDEIDDLLDYVYVKLEDLELEGEKMEDLAVPEAEENKGGAPLNVKMEEEEEKKKKKKKSKKKNTQTAETKGEAAALPDAETNIAPNAKDAAAAPKTKKEKQAKAEEDFFAKWSKYFGKRELADWQRLCLDLGLPGDLPSKTQCRKVSQHPPPPLPSLRQKTPSQRTLRADLVSPSAL
ncbi:uncharacterized protein GLRG_01362 [Colletotrichum graminicola M1.001]|uniref:Uncharacterized protein n=1 Tax=Colletotrichum graminicola (strain M1.001 / M2 / FGSC 10212) TaxID=645133 RepID=E3Q5X0_COLGM|nr:uncharacterized protein GLRG_01362 [Colletotrichum graminicola M1.001]EFQ26218.1 hypothetical protein GLRG_01362 [Colletotrichum graminicola M1.001]